jgi:hypothetical protein
MIHIVPLRPLIYKKLLFTNMKHLAEAGKKTGYTQPPPSVILQRLFT